MCIEPLRLFCIIITFTYNFEVHRTTLQENFCYFLGTFKGCLTFKKIALIYSASKYENVAFSMHKFLEINAV